jgi:type IV pilus assembly protein PilB
MALDFRGFSLLQPGPVVVASPDTVVAVQRSAPTTRTTIGQVLLAKQIISAEQLAVAIAQQHESRRRLGQMLLDLGFVTPDAVLGALSIQLGVPATRLNSFTVSPAAVRALPERVARKHGAVPLQKNGVILQIAVACPNDLTALDDIRFASGCQLQVFVALEDEIAAALDRFYAQGILEGSAAEDSPPVTIDVPSERRERRSGDRREAGGRRKSDYEVPADSYDEATEETAVRTVDRVLTRAASMGASDLHLERMADNLRVRFRVDGTFHDIGCISNAIAPAVCARLKVLAGMDIAEHRLPQDGRLGVTIGSRHLDFRASTFPTLHGEKIVLRMLDQSSLKLELGTLGLRSPLIEEFREVIHRPEGLILITGPTGSGKSSTLYAALRELIETGKNITTIENPVEYELPGINQGQINEKAGFTFAKGLRAVLRQDPDIIMVGEVRDAETLTTAVEASLTGHLVLSTLHTSSAVGTITRLLDLGIEPYFAASALQAIIAQRLVRRICVHCEVELPVPAGVRHLFGDDVPTSLRRGSGCTECRGTGFAGRIGIFEMLRMTDETRELVLARSSEQALLKAAAENGLCTLREQCLQRVREGQTTLEEVVRVT